MENPFDLTPNSGSYVNLRKRIIQRMQSAEVDEKILSLLRTAYDKEVQGMNIVLSRPERNRLFRQVTQAVLNSVVEKIDSK